MNREPSGEVRSANTENALSQIARYMMWWKERNSPMMLAGPSSTYF